MSKLNNSTMKKTKIVSKLALAGSLLMAATGAGRAQLAATLSEISSATPPVPGVYDSAQLLYSAVTGKPGGLNYYWDSGTPNGSTFYTGGNAGGYILNSVTIKTLGGGGSDGAGGISYSQPFDLYVYSVNGTTATLLAEYQSQYFSFATEGDWLQMSGMNLPLQPNTQYAYTFTRTLASWENLGFTNGIPASVGRACEIPTAGGTINFGSAPFYSGTFDIGLTQPTALTVAAPVASVVNPITPGTTVTLTAGSVVDNAGNGTYTYQWQTDGGSGGALTNIPGATGVTLAVNTTGFVLGNTYYQVMVTDSTHASAASAPLALDVAATVSGALADLGTTPPTPTSYDAAQLVSAVTYQDSGGLNYYYDNSTPPGDTFTTGSNPKGYLMSSVAVDFQGGTHNGTTSSEAFDLFIYSISADGTTATLLEDVTNLNFSWNYGDWLQWTFPAMTLQPNTVYAYTFHLRTSGGWAGASTSPGGGLYPGGQLCEIPAAGGAVTYGNTSGLNGTFDVSLVPIGINLVVGGPTAAPNPVYALSPVKLADTVILPTSGTFTYKWLTDDGSGAQPPNYIPLPGTASTNVTVVPQNLAPGGSYTTNYYFVATAGNSSATSAPVTLTVNAATAPILTASTSLSNNLVTFVGDNTLTYAVTEAGTLPISNQWQFNGGSGWVNLSGQTGASLALTNLQMSATGGYQVAATNVVGSTTNEVGLIVLPDPAPPTTSEAYAHLLAAAKPWVYWRLDETNDPTAPGAPIYSAYDYSGHGFDATYGNLVQVSTLASPLPGPQPPAFPGFSVTEAAVTTAAGAGGALAVPPLNLTGQTNLTFLVWINPSATPAGATGLLFDRLDPNDGANSAYGFGFDNNGNGELGYTWNNNSQATWSWNSGVAVANGQWNFVAYVVTPTNVSVYVGNLNNGTTNFYQASNPGANIGESWSGAGTINLGADANSFTGRAFQGQIAEAALLTNALSTAQVQQFFLTGIGAAALAPTVGAATASPNANVYSGQNVRLISTASGTAPLILQWQVSPDGNTWSNIAGANATSLLINPFTVGTFYYQLVASNAVGSASSGSVAVTFNALPTAPAGLWTANFQVVNNDLQSVLGTGLANYTGRGILGNGSYWNTIPDVITTLYSGINLASATDFADDGTTHLGIYTDVNGAAGYSSLSSPLSYATDVGNLLDQYVQIYYGPGALQLIGVPAGTYNVALYGVDGTYADRGTTFVVYDALNGNQTGATVNGTSGAETALSAGDNMVLFTNVHVSGTLTVDIDPTSPVPSHDPNTEADFNGVQIQLVSYDVPAPTVTLGSSYSAANSHLTVSWPQGILEISTNLQGPWTPVYAPSPLTFGTTNSAQFFRVKVK